MIVRGIRCIISKSHIVAGPQVHAAKEQVQYEAQINHLRHTKFVGLREDKDPRGVHKE